MFGQDPIFVVSSTANFAAAYNLAITGHILLLLELAGQPASETEDSAVASAILVGAVIGQFTFGYFAKRISVEFGLALALFLCSIGNVFAAVLAWKSMLYPLLIVFRFVVGLGAGGIYPLSAVASAESSKDGSNRGRRMIFVFSFQMLGQIAAPLCVVVLDYILPNASQAAWRIALLMGSVPSAYAIPMALKISSQVPRISERELSPRGGDYHPPTESVDSGEVEMIRGKSSACTSRNLVLLIGTAGTWFIFDIVFYGNVVFTPFIIEMVFGVGKDHPNKIAIGGYSVVIYLAALPGIYLASCVADIWGRKKLQIFGFTACSVIFCIMTFTVDDISEGPLFFLYLLTFFFYNFGPNATTFCLPAETFEKDVRAFFNGISAACGKLGAVVGAAVFKLVLDTKGLAGVAFGCFVLCVVGAVVTFIFVVDRNGQSLEDNEGISEPINPNVTSIDLDDSTSNSMHVELVTNT